MSISCTVFTARRYASAVYVVVVCPSVRLSDTRRHCIKTAKCRITQATSYYRSRTFVLWRRKSRRNSYKVTPNGGAK